MDAISARPPARLYLSLIQTRGTKICFLFLCEQIEGTLASAKGEATAMTSMTCEQGLFFSRCTIIRGFSASCTVSWTESCSESTNTSMNKVCKDAPVGAALRGWIDETWHTLNLRNLALFQGSVSYDCILRSQRTPSWVTSTWLLHKTLYIFLKTLTWDVKQRLVLFTILAP